MSRSVLPRLYDIDRNITFLRDLARGRTIKHFEHDEGLRYAAQYALLIISEAAARLPDDLRQQEPGIPWRDIIAIGNRLRHEYYRLDHFILWDVIHGHLEPLQESVRRLMSTEGYHHQ